MDQKKLIEWQENPTLIGKQEVEDLEKMLQDFPYFSLGQILLAKGYKNISHYKQEAQIKKASLYCGDREWLYHFLQNDTPQKPIQLKPQIEEKPKEKIEKIPEVEEKVTELKKELEPMEKEIPVVPEIPKETDKKVLKKLELEAPFKLKKESAWKTPVAQDSLGVEEKIEIEEPVQKEEVTVNEKKEVVIEEEKERENLAKPIAKELKPIPKKRGRPRKNPVVEDKTDNPAPKRRGRPPKVKTEEKKETLKIEENEDLATASTNKNPKEEEVKLTPKKRGRPRKNPVVEDKSDKPAPKKRGRPPKVKTEEVKEAKVKKTEPVKEEIKAKEPKKSKKKKKKKKKVILDEKDLLDELMRQNISYNLEDYYPEQDEVSDKVDSNVEDTTEGDPQDFFSWLKSTEEEEAKPIKKKKKTSKPANKEPKAHKSLSPIEEFLKNKDSIPKKKVSFFSPVEMAKKSDIIEGDIVSETLAKVYEDQEQFSEAILTYEKLILLFPQKETYFASRIENLRKRIDNN